MKAIYADFIVLRYYLARISFGVTFFVTSKEIDGKVAEWQDALDFGIRNACFSLDELEGSLSSLKDYAENFNSLIKFKDDLMVEIENYLNRHFAKSKFPDGTMYSFKQNLIDELTSIEALEDVFLTGIKGTKLVEHFYTLKDRKELFGSWLENLQSTHSRLVYNNDLFDV